MNRCAQENQDEMTAAQGLYLEALGVKVDEPVQ